MINIFWDNGSFNSQNSNEHRDIPLHETDQTKWESLSTKAKDIWVSYQRLWREVVGTFRVWSRDSKKKISHTNVKGSIRLSGGLEHHDCGDLECCRPIDKWSWVIESTSFQQSGKTRIHHQPPLTQKARLRAPFLELAHLCSGQSIYKMPWLMTMSCSEHEKLA